MQIGMQIDCVADLQASLGEGPLWDPARGVLWWLDIRGAKLHRHHADSGINHCQPLDCRLTALGLAAGGGLVACGDRGFVRLRVDPDLRVSIMEVLAVPAEHAGNRFNDGKVDEHGCFWAGTMDDAEQTARGALYRLQGDGRLRQVRDGIRVPNGPCFLADGTLLTTDTAEGVITALQLDAAGVPVAERTFARFTSGDGFPDGMTVDAQDHVWVAFWDGWCLRRLSPAGEVVARIDLPVQRPTCPAFGGELLQQLYVTSARVGLAAADLTRQPLAGGLLRLEPGVCGRPAPCFDG